MSKTKAIPEGMHSLTPHIVCKGAEQAMAWYGKAFGAKSGACLKGPGGGVMHGAVSIGDSVLMLVDENPDWNAKGPKLLGGSPVTLHLYVEDVDAVFNRAVAEGATVVMPVGDMFWGDRYGVLIDPWGHSWSIATHKEDLTPEQISANMAKIPMDGKH